MLRKILDFIGGKDPEIFNRKGEVEHKLGSKKWQDWDAKNKSNSEYNWKQHKGRNSQPGPKRPNS